MVCEENGMRQPSRNLLLWLLDGLLHQLAAPPGCTAHQGTGMIERAALNG
jgi:hypothetical protein